MERIGSVVRADPKFGGRAEAGRSPGPTFLATEIAKLVFRENPGSANQLAHSLSVFAKIRKRCRD
jgi:hypothetical protein